MQGICGQQYNGPIYMESRVKRNNGPYGWVQN